MTRLFFASESCCFVLFSSLSISLDSFAFSLSLSLSILFGFLPFCCVLLLRCASVPHTPPFVPPTRWVPFSPISSLSLSLRSTEYNRWWVVVAMLRHYATRFFTAFALCPAAYLGARVCVCVIDYYLVWATAPCWIDWLPSAVRGKGESPSFPSPSFFFLLLLLLLAFFFYFLRLNRRVGLGGREGGRERGEEEESMKMKMKAFLLCTDSLDCVQCRVCGMVCCVFPFLLPLAPPIVRPSAPSFRLCPVGTYDERSRREREG